MSIRNIGSVQAVSTDASSLPNIGAVQTIIVHSTSFYQFGKWSDNDASSVTTLHPFGNYYTPEPPVPRKFLFKLHTV